MSDWIPVSEPIRLILLALIDDWTPARLELGPIAEFRFNGKDYSENASVTLSSDRLVATIQKAHRLGVLAELALDGQFEGTLAAGGSFRGDMFLSVRRAADHTLEAGNWLVAVQEMPSLWVGRIEGAFRIAYGGNLIIERFSPGEPRAGHACHFRLSGAYTYYLVQITKNGETEWFFVVETGGGAPDSDALTQDFLLLQFVLGVELRIPELLGLTERRTVASMTGIGTRKCTHARSALPPVPTEKNNVNWVDDAWATVLFDRVSAAWVARPESRPAYFMAFDSYLDATTNHLDADYLRLHVALEAFSYWALRLANQEERMVVKSKPEWKKWVKESATAIRSLAAPGFENNLVDKVMGVYRLSSGRVVPSAFLADGPALSLTAEMETELEARDMIVHQGFMTEEPYDADRETRRIAIVRTMLVALIAKTSGYGGAINGWESGALGRPEEPPETWWKVSDEDRRLAQRRFVAEEPVRPAQAGGV